jgi:hypothetical protein
VKQRVKVSRELSVIVCLLGTCRFATTAVWMSKRAMTRREEKRAMTEQKEKRERRRRKKKKAERPFNSLGNHSVSLHKAMALSGRKGAFRRIVLYIQGSS